MRNKKGKTQSSTTTKVVALFYAELVLLYTSLSLYQTNKNPEPKTTRNKKNKTQKK